MKTFSAAIEIARQSTQYFGDIHNDGWSIGSYNKIPIFALLSIETLANLRAKE